MNYNNLSVGKYLRIRKLFDNEYEDIELQTKIISILKDISEDDVLNLPLYEYSEAAKEIDFLTERYKPVNKCPRRLKLGDSSYSINTDIRSINAAQFIDYNEYMKMKDPDALMPEILSILIIPEGKKYNTDYDIKKVHDDIREYMPISTAMDICFFFRTKQLKYSKIILIYLELTMKLMKRKMPKEYREKMEKATEELKQMEVLLRDMAG